MRGNNSSVKIQGKAICFGDDMEGIRADFLCYYVYFV